jgi:Uma2 family endonuclease
VTSPTDEPPSSAMATPSLTLAEYLAFEEAQELRHELVGGQPFAMVGGTRRHNLLVTELSARLHAAATRTPCRVYQHAMKLQVAPDTVYYPDVMVVCGDPPADERLEIAPCLVVEVLSPSTSLTDRREKNAAYRTLPSVEAYLILDPEAPRATLHRRQHDSTSPWHTLLLVDDDELELPCVPMNVPLSELYRTLT